MNTDKMTSWLGFAQAIGIAAVSFYTTENSDGVIEWNSPMLWVGLAVAVLVAVKAYYTKGIEVKPSV